MLIPSFLQRQSTWDGEVSRRNSNVAALDGLRGIAALFVFFFHILFSYTRAIEYGYGQGEKNKSVLQLPFLSLWYRGHSMVAVFFVVGGYVMSLKPLSLMHSHQAVAAPGALVSSVFRRSIRIYVPAVVASFSTMLTIWLGWWEYPRRFTTNERLIVYPDLHPEPKATFALQIWDWLYATAGLTNLFNYYNRDGFLLPYYNQYDPHLWTVPFEYRSSLIVTLVLLAFSRCKFNARVLFVASTIIFCGCWDRWELVCFLSGTLLCDIDIFNQHRDRRPARLETIFEEDEEKLPQWESGKPQSSVRDSVKDQDAKHWLLLFIVGLYLLSTPNLDIGNTPGYRTLYQLTPTTYTDKKRFLQSIGAVCTTWAVTNCPMLQQPFTSPFAQYLGRISYSLYVVHGPLIHIIGYSVTPNLWIHITEGKGWDWVAGLMLGSLVLGICVAVVADLFWRGVDQRSVKLARWFETICSAEI
jgi:peptidoglycan/LPS O-acetylase OafA/YrhL